MNKGIEILLGKVITKIDGLEKDSDEILFTDSDGKRYKLYHDQDCCEYVSIEDFTGDTELLLNSPITLAEENTSADNPTDIKKESQDSFTWTFYNLGTAKGRVTIRWYGESNGYYSESVDFEEL